MFSTSSMVIFINKSVKKHWFLQRRLSSMLRDSWPPLLFLTSRTLAVYQWLQHILLITVSECHYSRYVFVCAWLALPQPRGRLFVLRRNMQSASKLTSALIATLLPPPLFCICGHNWTQMLGLVTEVPENTLALQKPESPRKDYSGCSLFK